MVKHLRCFLKGGGSNPVGAFLCFKKNRMDTCLLNLYRSLWYKNTYLDPLFFWWWWGGDDDKTFRPCLAIWIKGLRLNCTKEHMFS
jgi:hypothetical protein